MESACSSLQKDLYYEKRDECDKAKTALEDLREACNRHIVDKALNLV